MLFNPSLQKLFLIQVGILFESLPHGVGHPRLIKTPAALNNDLSEVLAALSSSRRRCPAGSHTGTRNTHRPGWAYIQSTHKGLHVDEVIAVELAWEGKPVVERLAYIPNAKVGYLSETHGAVSFDGTKFCAVSNWGVPEGQVQAYVVDITELSRKRLNR